MDLDFKKSAPFVLGVDLGGTNVRASIIDRDGGIRGTGGRAPSQATEGVAVTVERAARKICEGRDTTLATVGTGDWHFLTPKDIAEAAGTGDAVALEVFEETGYYVGLGVASIVNLLSPEMIVIGGGVAQAGDLIFDPICRSARANSIQTLLAACQIVPAKLGDDAGVFGGASLILDKLD